ncbi:MAG: DUF4474 domain-containing protein [Chitinophagaceae bacterium]|nr:DUF4474 domain-containing protein [Chitinophagaceae bacterium]
MAQWSPTSTLAQATYTAGFLYDPSQDILYSRMDALQRNFGYAYGYDKAAILANFAIDCEPIFFSYDNKLWMIELWKGQYMIETGCEVGVYTRYPNDHSFTNTTLDGTIGKRDNDSTPSHNLFYDCATDEDMLLISYTLFRNGQQLFTRGPEKHWWLTGFKWGVYSTPEQLVMNISITFPDTGMLNAFVEALNGMGYRSNVNGTTVSFVFDKPKTYQPRLSNPTTLARVNAGNQQVVNAYASYHLPNNDPNQTPVGAQGYVMQTILAYKDFFSDILDNDIGSLSDWAQTLVGMLGKVFAMDDSCAVEFDNQSTTYTLVLNSSAAVNGTYLVPAPDSIAPGNRGRLYLKDPTVTGGSEGWVMYNLVDQHGNSQPVKFSFNCPEFIVSNNEVSIVPANKDIYFVARSGTGQWGTPNVVPKSGHPLLVRFVITDPLVPGLSSIKVNIKINNYFLTAVNRGGMGDAPGYPKNSWAIHSTATTIGKNEIFTFMPLNQPVNGVQQFAILAPDGLHYLTAVKGGGIGDPPGVPLNSIAIHTDATQGRDWEGFTLIPQGPETSGVRKFAIQTPDGHYLTAVNGGGLGDPPGLPANYSAPIHTDATWVSTWETFTVVFLMGGE